MIAGAFARTPADPWWKAGFASVDAMGIERAPGHTPACCQPLHCTSDATLSDLV